MVAFILALGDSTFVFKWAYELPLFNLFRVHGRLMMIVSFAVAVLAAMGLASLQRRGMSLTSRLAIVVVFCSVVLGLLWWTVTGRLYQTYGDNLTSLALSVPLVLLALAALIVLFWRKPLQNHSLTLALLLFLTVDLTSASWYFPWHYKTVPVAFLQPSEHHLAYKEQLDAQNHRFAAMDGFWSKVVTPDQASV